MVTNHDASFLRFDTIPARDGQTDRHVAITITRASIASRDARQKPKATLKIVIWNQLWNMGYRHTRTITPYRKAVLLLSTEQAYKVAKRPELTSFENLHFD